MVTDREAAYITQRTHELLSKHTSVLIHIIACAYQRKTFVQVTRHLCRKIMQITNPMHVSSNMNLQIL